jgi:hypothetical protein
VVSSDLVNKSVVNKFVFPLDCAWSSYDNHHSILHSYCYQIFGFFPLRRLCGLHNTALSCIVSIPVKCSWFLLTATHWFSKFYSFIITNLNSKNLEHILTGVSVPSNQLAEITPPAVSSFPRSRSGTGCPLNLPNVGFRAAHPVLLEPRHRETATEIIWNATKRLTPSRLHRKSIYSFHKLILFGLSYSTYCTIARGGAVGGNPWVASCMQWGAEKRYI